MSFAKLLNGFISSEELFPISFATLLNEFVFSEELFPISFAKSLNEFVFLEELFPISFAKLLNEIVFSEAQLFSVSIYTTLEEQFAFHWMVLKRHFFAMFRTLQLGRSWDLFTAFRTSHDHHRMT